MTELLDVRDNKGRFGKGNKAALGRHPRRDTRDYMLATIGRVALEDWEKVVDRALSDAKKGDAKSREWLAKYLLGDPQVTLQAIQVNQYQAESGEVGENTLLAFAQLMARMSSALSETQRADFNKHMLALTEIVTPPEAQETEPYTVDEHGVVSFADQIKPYINV